MPKYYSVYVHAHQEKQATGFFLYGLVVNYTLQLLIYYLFTWTFYAEHRLLNSLAHCFFCMSTHDDDDGDAAVLITAIV